MAFKKSVILNLFSRKNFSSSVTFWLQFYFILFYFFLRVNNKLPGMIGLFISIHTSCPYNDEPSIYKLFINYIISINITSFWNQKCSIG